MLLYTVGVNMEEILWVLTVPAIWDDTAKMFMKEAAKLVIIYARSYMTLQMLLITNALHLIHLTENAIVFH